VAAPIAAASPASAVEPVAVTGAPAALAAPAAPPVKSGSPKGGSKIRRWATVGAGLAVVPVAMLVGGVSLALVLGAVATKLFIRTTTDPSVISVVGPNLRTVQLAYYSAAALGLVGGVGMLAGLVIGIGLVVGGFALG
jgi:hypothetical protein